ncbi:MAG TPA: flagellar hook-associated protein FlgL [Paralcaligenes sp.]
MRISSSQLFQTGLNAINAQQADVMHVYQQIASGQRMVTPADDPLAASQAINIAQSQSLNQRFAANRDVASRNLGTEDNVLGTVTTQMQAIKASLVQAGNGALSDVDRATLADTLSSAKSSLLTLANSTDDNGQYLFSGSQGTQAPFVADASGTVTATLGVSGQRLIQVDPTRQMASSDLGADIFVRATPGTQVYLTAAASGNTGTGQIGTPTVTDPLGANVGKNFSISFNGSPLQYTINMTDAAGVAAGSVGPLAYQANSTMLDLTGGVQIQFSGQPSAGDTFTVDRAVPANLNVFSTLDDAIAALKAPSAGNAAASVALSNALSTAIQKTSVVYDNVLAVRASVGSRMNEIDALNASGTQRDVGYSTQLSQLESVDYYAASTQLQLRQSALDAASLAFKKIQGNSLFNMGNGG